MCAAGHANVLSGAWLPGCLAGCLGVSVQVPGIRREGMKANMNAAVAVAAAASLEW